MTAAELAILRDRVTRAKLAMPSKAESALSPRELAGRQALAALREAEQRFKALQRLCVYCGGAAKGRKLPLTCAEHRDLPANDPFYNEVAA